jgi:hypothetical protein
MNIEKANMILEALRKDNAMNEWDLENLKFLLTSDQSTMEEWFDYVEEDDVEYARTLLNIAQDYFSDDAVEIDITQSRQFLKKFML